MRSLQQHFLPRLALLLALAVIASACGGSNDSAAVAEQPTAPAIAADPADPATSESAAVAEPETADVPSAEPAVRGAWVIEIGDGRVVSTPEQTICLKIPGGTFAANGGGDNGFGAEFFFYLGSEGGAEFNYDIAGNRTVDVSDETEGGVEIDYDADSGATIATGFAQNGVPITITGIC